MILHNKVLMVAAVNFVNYHRKLAEAFNNRVSSYDLVMPIYLTLYIYNINPHIIHSCLGTV